MRIFNFTLPRELRNIDYLVDVLHRQFDSMVQAINGRISFGDGTSTDNIQGYFADLTSDATPDTEFEVSHTLGRVPTGFIVFHQDKAGSLYKGVTAWSSSKIYLKSNIASLSAKIFIV